MRGSEGSPEAFWRGLRDSPILKDHPLQEKDWATCIPLGLHGDGGAFSKQDSLFVLSWNSLCAGAASEGFARRFIFTIVRKRVMTTETMDALWKIFSWSMNNLFTGITPSTDWEGRPREGGAQYVAQGWQGALVQIRGDWEFYANVLGVPNWASALNMCWFCKASNSTPHLLWTLFGLDAGWRPTRRTHNSWIEELTAEGKEQPLLFKLVIGLTLPCLMVDVLHAVDQGVASHVIGNIFLAVIGRRAAGTMESRAMALGEELENWCKAHKVKSRIQGKLTIARLRNQSGFPKLKAKAAATRHVSEFALHIAKAECGGDKRVVAVAQLMCRFYKELATAGMFLEQDVVDRVAKIGRQLCCIYADMARESLATGVRMWKLAPKFHLFQHLCEWQIAETPLNPRTYWTYADEDLVGQMVEVSASCHVSTLPAVALSKWVLLALD